VVAKLRHHAEMCLASAQQAVRGGHGGNGGFSLRRRLIGVVVVGGGRHEDLGLPSACDLRVETIV
jgi:hypothetical protein